MATQNIQLKDGNGNLLMPKTGAEIVDVQFNAQTKPLSDRLDEMKFIHPVDVASGTRANGYVNTNGKWATNTSTYGVIIDISAYRGLRMVVQKGTGNSLYRIAFLKTYVSTNNAIVDYASNSSLEAQTDNNPHEYTIPYDCTYLYVFRFTSKILFTPTITIFDNADPSALAKLHMKASGNLPNKVIATFYPRAMQYGAGYIETSASKYGYFTASSSYVGMFIPVTAYRGKRIVIYPRETTQAWATRTAFTKTAPTATQTSSILCASSAISETSGIVSYVIPDDCNYVYFYANYSNIYYAPIRMDVVENDYDTAVTEAINEQNERVVGDDYEMNFGNTKVARVFGHYFPNISSDNELNGLDNATITADGISLPSGVSSPITHNKYFVFDDEEITLDVTASTTDKILMYCTNSAAGVINASDVESYILFDFTTGTISVYNPSTVSASTGLGTAVKTGTFTASAGTFRLSIGRKRRNVFASVYNYATKLKEEVFVDEIVYIGVNVQIRPAGWMYRYPSFLTIEGTPVYKRFGGYTKTDLYMLFQGDSYTQGYAGLYLQAWSYRAAKYFKNSRTCGISGAKIGDMITQYHDSIKGKIEVKVMVITIGINDMSDLTSDALIATWTNTFKSYCDELVADGIIPIVNRIWPEGSATSATATKARKMNDAIRALGYDGADFGAVPGYTTNTEYYTQGHLSPNGNNLSYDIFINELSMYKQD